MESIIFKGERLRRNKRKFEASRFHICLHDVKSEVQQSSPKKQKKNCQAFNMRMALRKQIYLSSSHITFTSFHVNAEKGSILVTHKKV